MAGAELLSNHGLVLLCLARDPQIRIRDVADRVGITERTAQRIVNELVDEGYVLRRRAGARNRYELRPEAAMRHPELRQQPVSRLLAALGADGRARGRPNASEAAGGARPG